MNTLGREPKGIPLGTTDALHVPFVIAQTTDFRTTFRPKDWVKFKDTSFTEFIPATKEEALGMIDPFLNEIPCYTPIAILIIPGMTTPVRHNFEINPELKKAQDLSLTLSLEETKENDPLCAECWFIRNGDLVRA